MDSSASIQNRTFINADVDASKASALVPTPAKNTSSQTQVSARRNDPIINYGSPEVIADAQAMFNRANSYADLSTNIKKGLQAYEAVDMNQRQEALKQLMGVDIYA